MEQIFIKVLNLAISSSLLILAVILIRILFRKAPKWCICLLWGMVAIALLVPVRLQTRFSLIPNYSELLSRQNELISYSESPSSVLENNDAKVNPISDTELIPLSNSESDPVDDTITETSVAPGTNMQPDSEKKEKTLVSEPLRWTQIAGSVWLFGIAGMILYGLFSYLFLVRKVSTAVREEQNVYLSESISTPFILGLKNPRIYLPLGVETEDKEFILAHERVHQKRLDYLSKMLAFAVLAIYWFHPLVWVSYILFNRDIELACDEKVIRKFNLEQRKKYSKTLLKYSMQNHGILISPPAFGKEGVKMRINHVIQYKQPKIWSVLLLIAVCIPLTACLMTNKTETEQSIEAVPETNVATLTDDRDIPSLLVVDRTGEEITVLKTQSIPAEKPSELVGELPVVNKYRGDSSVLLKFEQNPSKVDVKCWSEKRAESWNEDYKMMQYSVRYGKVAYIPSSLRSSDYEWIYQITAEYPEGDYQYYFRVDTNEERPEEYFHAYSEIIDISKVEPTECMVLLAPSGNMEGIDSHSEIMWYALKKMDDPGWNRDKEEVGIVVETIPINEDTVVVNWEKTYGELPEGVYYLYIDTKDYLNGDDVRGTSVSICHGWFEITE